MNDRQRRIGIASIDAAVLHQERNSFAASL
jgi:hypothetical protein